MRDLGMPLLSVSPVELGLADASNDKHGINMDHKKENKR